ncbi:MAG: 30S ribosomal protein S24e [Candidatus Micrarchaeota archaeon]
MDIKITEQRENPLLKRTDVKFVATFANATPSRSEVGAELAKKLGVDIANIAINDMIQGFGEKKVKGYAKVYVDSKTKEATEHKYRLERGIKKEKKEGEEAAPAKK